MVGKHCIVYLRTTTKMPLVHLKKPQCWIVCAEVALVSTVIHLLDPTSPRCGSRTQLYQVAGDSVDRNTDAAASLPLSCINHVFVSQGSVHLLGASAVVPTYSELCAVPHFILFYFIRIFESCRVELITQHSYDTKYHKTPCSCLLNYLPEWLIFHICSHFITIDFDYLAEQQLLPVLFKSKRMTVMQRSG